MFDVLEQQVTVGSGAAQQAGPGPQQTVNPYAQPQQAGYGYQAPAGFYAGAPGGPQAAPQAAASQYAQFPNYAAYPTQPDN